MNKWILALFIATNAFAAPKSLEIWFLSNAKVSEIQEYIKNPPIVFRPLTAELQCQQMGEFCFDPQFGLYKKEHENEEVDINKAMDDKAPIIPVGKSVDRDLINCDPSSFFDVFCGKSRKESTPATKAKLDLWIDTSSSMREFDFSDSSGNCHRKSLVMGLDKICPFNQKVNVMMFDTSIKQAGSMDSLCLNQGLNDYKRLMDWIERSEAQKLVVITDIYEFHKDFSDFVEKKDGIFRGDKDPLTAAKMADLVEVLAKSCR